MTPALTNTLTVNPDFSDAPLDIRQVNTTRFSLFTPETRDFFLQDVSAFEFGGRSFGRNSQDRVSNNGRPFFSRNIGLVQGRPVSLIVGDKLSGQFGGFDIGAFSVLTDKTPTGEGGQILSVARVTHPIFAESKFGFVVTNGDPTGLTENTVAGVDFQYRNSNYFRRQGAAGRRLLHEELLEHGRRRRIGGVRRSTSRTSRGPAISCSSRSARTSRRRSASSTAPRSGNMSARSTHLTRYREHVSQHARIRHQFRVRHRSERRAGIARATTSLCAARSRIGDQVTVAIDQCVRERAGAVLPAAERAGLAGDVRVDQCQRRGVRTFYGRLLTLNADVTCCSFYDGSAVRRESDADLPAEHLFRDHRDAMRATSSICRPARSTSISRPRMR